MIEVSFAGYVNRPETKTSGKGTTYNQYTVRTKFGKDKDGKPAHAYITCRDCPHQDHTVGELPKEGAFVRVKGNLSVREYEGKDKTQKLGLDCFVKDLLVSPPKENGLESTGLPKWVTE